MPNKIIPTNPAYTELEYGLLNNYFVRACRFRSVQDVNQFLVLGANINEGSTETILHGKTG